MAMKDYCYASLVSKNDLPYLYNYAAEIRRTHNQNLVDDFNNVCKRKWNDHKSVLEVGEKSIEFLQTSKADDLITDVGRNQLVDQILGTSVVRWLYMQYGDQNGGNFTPSTGETVIIHQLSSINMSSFGWIEYAGTTLKFGAIAGESIAT